MVGHRWAGQEGRGHGLIRAAEAEVEFRKEPGAAGRGGARLGWAGARAGPRVGLWRSPGFGGERPGRAGWVGPEGRVLYGAGFTARGGRALLLYPPPAPELHCLPDPGTRRPGGGGRRNAAMAPGELSGSAVLAAAVFVGGTVSSPLVAPGECPIRAWALGRRQGVRTAAPLRPELPLPWHSRGIPTLNIWLLEGGPGRVRREATAPVPPFPLAGDPPSLLSPAPLTTCYP